MVHDICDFRSELNFHSLEHKTESGDREMQPLGGSLCAWLLTHVSASVCTIVYQDGADSQYLLELFWLSIGCDILCIVNFHYPNSLQKLNFGER